MDLVAADVERLQVQLAEVGRMVESWSMVSNVDRRMFNSQIHDMNVLPQEPR